MVMATPRARASRASTDSGFALYDEMRRACRERFASFLYATSPPGRGDGPHPLSAPHIRGMYRALQTATEHVESGRSYYAIVMCPPQHWKSSTCGQRYPVWHLGRNPTHRVLEVSYSSAICNRNSRNAMRLMQTPLVRELFGVETDRRQQSVASWALKAGGGMNVAGFGGSITGHRADVIIIDDYCKGRAEAESKNMRDRVWDSFVNDVMSRRAPAHAVIIVATPWHEDDLVGRIRREMAENEAFPRFEVLRYPAWTEGRGWLFP